MATTNVPTTLRTRRRGHRLPSVAAALIVATSACSNGESAPRVDGADVYANNCASCHGADLRGTDQGPSQLSVVYEPGHHGDDAYRRAIENGAGQHHWGFGDMPPVIGLDDDEVEAVIAFIRSRQEALGFEPYSP